MNAASKTQEAEAVQRRAQRQEQERSDLRSNVDALRSRGSEQQAFDILFGVIESLQHDNERLLYRVAASVRAHFGRSSEKLNAEELGQLILALGGTEEEAAVPEPLLPHNDEPKETSTTQNEVTKTKKKRRNHKGRTALAKDLPRVVTEILVPDAERKCIQCGIEMQCIDHVDHETVEFIPARIEVHVERREKIACKNVECKSDITTAPRQKTQPYERRAGMSLLAQLIEAKCDDALPVYRQQDQLRRLGFEVPANTLYGYWDYAATLLEPVAASILSTVLGEDIVGVDDTRLNFLDRADAKGIRRGHLWCFVGTSPLVAFSFTESWEAKDIAPWLFAIDGFIQCDDYSGYDSKIIDDGEKKMLVPHERRLGCMMHVRRRFHKAYKGGNLTAAVPLNLIASIYKIEERARGPDFTSDMRLALRQHESAPVLDDFEKWVDANAPKYTPNSPVGQAIRYATHQRPFIRRCFSDGRFEIDNGLVERHIREPALGRKNFLFSGSAEAAGRLASAYTVVQSARRTGLPVRTYLVDILTKINGGWPARRLTELLPHRWAALHAPAHKPAEQA